MLPNGRELTELIAPHGLRDFLNDHWHGKPLYIAGPPKKFSHLGIDLRAVESTIREGRSSDRVQVRYVGPDNKLKNAPENLERYSIQDGDLTVCVDWISDRYEALGAYCAGVKSALSLPGSIFMTCYASPDGHGFGTHFDCHPSFILQLQRSKRWRYSAQPALAWPPANLSNAGIVPEMMERYGWIEAFPFPDANDEEGFLEQVLKPGDVLFLPAGTWHRAQAIGPSVALTMTCMSMTAADFFDDLIRGQLSRSVAWRQNVPAVTAEETLPDRFSPMVARFFSQRLTELKRHVESLSASDLYGSWTHYVHSFDTPFEMEDKGHEIEFDETDTLSLSSEFPFRYVVSPQKLAVSLYYLDKRIDLDYEALPLVKGIASRSPFTGKQAMSWLGAGSAWPDVKPVLEELVEAGLLRISRRRRKAR